MSFFKSLTADLTRIPTFMDGLKWPTSAALMRRWFAGAMNSDPFKGVADTTTVNMQWLLGFSRAKSMFDSMVNDKIWVNAAAQQRIGEIIRAKGLLRARGATSFGNLQLPVPTLRADQVNSRKFAADNTNDPLDDMFGALGDFNFDVAVEGTVTPLISSPFQVRVPPLPFSAPMQPKPQREFLVTLTKVGIFAWDKYDFNGHQPLGFWNFKTGQVSKSPGTDFDEVDNGDFRDWRDANHLGGDYLLFTDLKIIPLTSSAAFTVQG